MATAAWLCPANRAWPLHRRRSEHPGDPAADMRRLRGRCRGRYPAWSRIPGFLGGFFHGI